MSRWTTLVGVAAMLDVDKVVGPLVPGCRYTFSFDLLQLQRGCQVDLAHHQWVQ